MTPRTARLRARNAQKHRSTKEAAKAQRNIEFLEAEIDTLYKDREDLFWSNRNTFLALGVIQKDSDERIAKLEARVKRSVNFRRHHQARLASLEANISSLEMHVQTLEKATSK
jgi:cell division protein FtsB